MAKRNDLFVAFLGLPPRTRSCF